MSAAIFADAPPIKTLNASALAYPVMKLGLANTATSLVFV